LGRNPCKHTGIIEFINSGTEICFKSGELHREDGPAVNRKIGDKMWYLDGNCMWSSTWNNLDLRNKIILSKNPHPKYFTVQVWKWLDKNRIREQIVIPGMEKWFIE